MRRRVSSVILYLLLFALIGTSCNHLSKSEKIKLSDSNQSIKLDKYGYISLKSIPDDYTVEKAIKDGVIHISIDGIDNNEGFLIFFTNIQDDIDSMIRTLQYTTEGDLVYTDIIFHSENSNNLYFEYNEKTIHQKHSII